MLSFEKNHSSKDQYVYHQFDENLSFPLHIHKSFEFVYVESGNLLLGIGQKEYTISSGNCAIILPNQFHYYKTTSYSHSYLCIFSTDYLYDFYHQTKKKEADNPVFHLENPEIISNLCTPNINIYEQKSIFYALIGQWLHTTTFFEASSIENYDLAEIVVSFLQKHFQEPITLMDIANTSGYSYTYLSGWLNMQFKMNFSEMLNHYRIDYACEQLLGTSKPITDISADSGYNSIRSFNRNFLRIRGKTPQQFRSEGPLRSSRHENLINEV